MPSSFRASTATKAAVSNAPSMSADSLKKESWNSAACAQSARGQASVV